MKRFAVLTRRGLPASRVMLLVGAIAMLTWRGAVADARDTVSESRSQTVFDVSYSSSELERAFWSCDYAATIGWVGAGEGAMCGAVTEELKRSRFNGDFSAMLSWWQRNKAAAHRALDPTGPNDRTR